MTTTVTHPRQTLAMTEVARIEVTAVESADGVFKRALRIWGSDGTLVPPTIEIVVSADTAAAIKIATPELVF